jgi:hypothetical protein
MSVLLSLYPKRWRERYGAEFAGLLAERPASLRDHVDVVRGAFDAHLHPQVPGSARTPDRVPDRFGLVPLGGMLAFVGALLIAANGPVVYDEYGSYREGGAALPFIILAFALLSLGLYRVIESLPATAVGARAAGWTAIVAGLAWSPMLWLLPIGLVFMIGTVGLAVGAHRAGIWPTWAVVMLVVTLAVPTALFAASLFLPWYWLRGSGVNILLAFACIGVPWPLFGGMILRGSPRPMPA